MKSCNTYFSSYHSVTYSELVNNEVRRGRGGDRTYSGGFNQFKERNPRRESPSKQETENRVVANRHLSLKSPEDRTDVSLVVLSKGDEFLWFILVCAHSYVNTF